MTLRRSYLLAIGILLLATWLRVHDIDAQSFWNDEGNSARLSERSLRLIIEGTASDVHPPLHYFVLRGWRVLVGESELALRAVSAFAGILTVALVIPFARYTRAAVRPTDLGLLAAFFVAFNPALLYYSQEARMYTLLPLLALSGTVILFAQLQGGGREDGREGAKARRRKGQAVGYVLVMAAGLYTHYFFPVVFAMHGAIILLTLSPRQIFTPALKRWVGQVLVAFVLFIPWLPYVLNGLGGNRGEPQSAVAFLGGLAGWIWFGLAHEGVGMTILWSVGALGAVFFFRPKTALTYLILILLPVIALITVGATDAEFYKFLLLIVPPASVAFASIWLNMLNQPLRQGWLMQIGTVAFLLLALGYSLDRWQTANADFARDDYRGIAAQISAENHPNAAIILNAPNQWEVFTYYYPDGPNVFPLPRSRDQAATQAELDQIGADYDRIYTLYWGDTQQDPEHWVENWLNQSAFKASEEWRGDVRFVTYALPSGAAGELQVQTDAQFGDEIVLDGYGVNSAELRPNDIIELSLFWTASTTPDARYKTFVHLRDASGQIVAQKDSEPTPFTSDWTPNQQVAVNQGVLIPSDLAAGQYELVVGLYAAEPPNARLQLPDQSDQLQLTPITILP